MEEYSRAWVRAVASAAGAAVDRPTVDVGIDISFSWDTVNAKIRSAKVEAQLKCTSQDVLSFDRVKYPLPLKNYDDLIMDDILVQRILIVVLVPHDPGEWIAHADEYMALRQCGYWVSLRGYPKSANASSVTVEIPIAHAFTVSGLKGIMKRVEEGKLI